MITKVTVNIAGLGRDALIEAFPEGHVIDMHAKRVFVVGDNGSGKTTLLEAIAGKGLHGDNALTCGIRGGAKFCHFDCEKDNPRTKSYIDNLGVVAARFASHGQVQRALLCSMPKEANIALVDEPETALSMAGLREVIAAWKKRKRLQIIAATHNQTLLLAFPGALIVDLDSRPARTITCVQQEFPEVWA